MTRVMKRLRRNTCVDIARHRRSHRRRPRQVSALWPVLELLDQIEQGAERAYIAWHSVSNLYYIVAPARGGLSARDFIVELTRFVEVATTGTEAIRYAAGLPMGDFEDAMQVAAARACGARHIVTRNVRDYERSPIRAIDPQEALTELF